MSASHAIPPELLAHQREASDPALSAWVSANAGSGKTYVLAQRVIRLLLGGAPPSKILCLTFTKAAAANMATSVFDTLAHWTTLDDAELDAAIGTIARQRPQAHHRAAARRLFAQALETPGGLKVQTIHAFCTRLLQQFPFEANVPARFTVLDATAESQLIDRLVLDVLLAGAAQPDSATGRALAAAIAAATDQSFRDVLGEAIDKRGALMGFIDHAGGTDGAIAKLAATLGLGLDETTASIEAAIFAEALIAAAHWSAAAAALAAGSKTDAEQGARFAALETAAAPERFDLYTSIFCTKEGGARARMATNAIRDQRPRLFELLIAEQERVCRLLDRRRASLARDRSAALITIAAAVIDRFRAEKDRRGLLDYDDLIDKTRVLLTRVEAAWVHYKLDLGIDHVLIDEAQDTSPRQWDVIERLVAEFATGEGAREPLRRTIFAVGDDKQSIFSFQGALPEAFAEKRRSFKRRYDEAGLRFLPVELKYSFRSSPVVLEAVDLVFRQPAAYQGLTTDQVPTAHLAVRSKAPGLVEVWPLVEPQPRPEIEGWDAPFDTTSETSPRVALARKIARHVAATIARGVAVGDGDERHGVTPGDFLVLVRQRGPLFEAVIRALKNAGIAVAGADRMVLTEHIAVMDLMALADALLLPEDDLALATVLKSPLFGLDEEELFGLAFDRRGTLLAALHAKAASSPVLAEAAARLDRLAEAARRETPFGFYARVLGPEGGRKRFLARLGIEAADALDEFLNIALDFERRQTPSLQGFVAWLRSANAEVKRDMEISRDEVRVMTVHGAKGLEAPIVILADTTSAPAGPPQRQPRLLQLAAVNAPPDTPGPLVWAAARKDDVPALAKARDDMLAAAENEYRRLLYVAMTRAADRLIICGATGERAKPEGCWHDLVHNALAANAVEEPADDGDGMVWRYRGTPVETGAAAARAAKVAAPASGRPDWLERNAPIETLPERSLAPSRADPEDMAIRPDHAGSSQERIKALARGELMHRLLQALPDIAPERRAEAARRYIERAAAPFGAAERERMVEQIGIVLADARFADLFGPGSRAEVPIVGRIVRAGRSVAVSGQIDRLVVTPAGVLIADYKTNRPAPRLIEDVPRAYLTQLALYRAVLGRLYPDKAVRAVLVWTDVPDLMEISAAALEDALDRPHLPVKPP